jgi:hypothetical protein
MKRSTIGGLSLSLLAAAAVAGEPQTAAIAKGAVLKELTKATLVRSNLNPEGPRHYTEEVTNPETLRRLAESLPGAGQNATSPVEQKWDTFAKIELHRATGEPVIVRVDSHLDVWSNGHGDWQLPVEFRDFFIGLLKDHDGVEWPGEPFARGEILPKVKKATITRFYDESNHHLPQPLVTFVTDTKSLKQLLGSFPGVGAGNQSPMAGGWVARVRIDLEREGKPSVTVKISPGLGVWSEGQGDWGLRPGFAELFAKLVGE